MPSVDWKNSRDPYAGTSETMSLRMPKPIAERIRAIAEEHNSTITAIIRYALKDFIDTVEQHNAPPGGKAGLFE